MKRAHQREPPNRSPEVWAREFVRAFNHQTGGRLPLAVVQVLARKDTRLRERVPASVVKIVERSAEAMGLPPEEWARLAAKHFSVLIRQPREVRRGLRELKQTLGLENDGALRLVKLQPILVCYAPGGIKRRLAALAKATGLGVSQSRQCARRCPNLLTFKPATLAVHVRKQRRALGLALPDYAKLVVREPRVLVRNPDAIERFLKDMVKLWGIPRPEALELFIKAPKLVVSGLASTMDGNMTKLARGLGCEKAELLGAVKSFPAMAYQKPERLLAALGTGARILGVSKKTLAGAALRSPSLLARRPEGWSRRMRLVIRTTRALGVETTAKEVLEQFPAAMTYGWERLLQRYVMARLGLWSRNWSTLLCFSDERARKKLREYFRQHRERQGLKRALTRRGLV